MRCLSCGDPLDMHGYDGCAQVDQAPDGGPAPCNCEIWVPDAPAPVAQEPPAPSWLPEDEITGARVAGCLCTNGPACHVHLPKPLCVECGHDETPHSYSGCQEWVQDGHDRCGCEMWTPAPGSAQEPADPPQWEQEAMDALHDEISYVHIDDFDKGWAAMLPILRAGIAAEIEASIGNVVGESHAYCEGKRDAADIVRGES